MVRPVAECPPPAPVFSGKLLNAARLARVLRRWLASATASRSFS